MNLIGKLRLGLLLSVVVGCSQAVAGDPSALAEDMRLGGLWGAAQARAARRMAAPPLDSVDFILADLSQKQKRRYTDYSGDISGRWIGVAAFLAPLYPEPFTAFPKIMAEIPTYQKSDGHFGVDQDLPRMEFDRDKAILWGNGRLLIGLIEVYERTGDKKALETAKKLGEYFIVTDPVCNKPENMVRKPGGYYVNFETYYLSCIDGLAALGRVTEEDRLPRSGQAYCRTGPYGHELRQHSQPRPVVCGPRVCRTLRRHRQPALARRRRARLEDLHGQASPARGRGQRGAHSTLCAR